VATLTQYSGTADGQIESSNTTYATARTGGTLTATTNGTAIRTGQLRSGGGSKPYSCFESFIGFDTSSIGSTSTIDSATLSLYGQTDTSTQDFTINARFYDWGASLTTADWISGASLSSSTLFATFATSGFSTSGYNNFTTSTTSGISKTATTNLVISSSRHEGANTPADATPEHVDVYAADQTGTTNDPKLVVNYTPVVNAAITGVVATASADANAGTVAAIRIAAITGVVATSAADANAGSVAAQVAKTIAGEAATALADANAGTVTATGPINATITGEAATATAEANAGTVTAQAGISTDITGVPATADADALAGTVAALVTITITGVAATADAEAQAGTVQAQVTTAIAGTAATADAVANDGSVTTVRIVTLNGETATATATAIAGIPMPVVIKDDKLPVYPSVWASKYRTGKNWQPPKRRRPW